MVCGYFAYVFLSMDALTHPDRDLVEIDRRPLRSDGDSLHRGEHSRQRGVSGVVSGRGARGMQARAVRGNREPFRSIRNRPSVGAGVRICGVPNFLLVQERSPGRIRGHELPVFVLFSRLSSQVTSQVVWVKF